MSLNNLIAQRDAETNEQIRAVYNRVIARLLAKANAN